MAWTQEDQTDFDTAFVEAIEMFEAKAGLERTEKLIERLLRSIHKEDERYDQERL